MEPGDLKVGQRLWTSYNGRQWQRGQVVKIGRKLVHVATVWGRDGEERVSPQTTAFRLDTQRSNAEQYGYGDHFVTDEQRDREAHEAEIRQYLRDVGIQFGNPCLVTGADKEKLAEFLRGLGYTGKLSPEQARAGKR